MPILGDLYELLRKQSEPEAQNIATALEIYVNGSLKVFNHRSNIDMDSHRVLCFQLKSLGKALKEIGLLIMQEDVYKRQWYISIIHSWCSRADERYPLNLVMLWP